MRLKLSLVLMSICTIGTAQNFLKADLAKEAGKNYSISFAVSASFFNPLQGRNQIVNIKVDGAPEGDVNFISEDVTNFFVSTVIMEELKMISDISRLTLKSYTYQSTIDQNDVNLELKLTLKPDRVVVKAKRIGGGNLPDIPAKEFAYDKYMK